MNYEFQRMRPIDEFDSVITILARPNWLEQRIGLQTRVLKYYGSGTTWRKGRTGARCDDFTSEWLRGIWNRQLNRRLEAKNCYGNGSRS